MTKNIEKRTQPSNKATPSEAPRHWLTLNGQTINDSDNVARRMVVHSDAHDSGFYAPFHSHDRGQLLFISEGLIQVSAQGSGYWVVPPQRAVWIPPYVEHDALTVHTVKIHNVYITEEISQNFPNHCQVVTITPLMRQLILTMATFDMLYDERGPDGRLVSVFLDQLKTTPEVPLHLPQPSSPALKTIANTLRTEPSDKRSMDDWGSELGLSARTLARRFRNETNMTFGQWRQQARLLEAISRIANNEPIANIALDLGYDSQSAFISMFRKALGRTPGQYFQGE